MEAHDRRKNNFKGERWAGLGIKVWGFQVVEGYNGGKWGDLKGGRDMGLGGGLPKFRVSENSTRKLWKLIKNKIIKGKEVFCQHKPTSKPLLYMW